MRFSTVLDLVRAELRVLGWLLFAVPVAVALVLAAFAGMMFVGNVMPAFIADLLIADLEACLPLAIGVAVATLAVQDSAIELQLSLPTAYWMTAFRRFALILLWTMLVELLGALVLQLTLPWMMPKPFGAMQLAWLAPTLWFSAVGILLSLLLHNRATSAAILGCIWVFQLAFHGFFAANAWTQPWFLFATLYTPGQAFWLTNRCELIVTALVLFGVAWWYLLHTEWRFRGED